MPKVCSIPIDLSLTGLHEAIIKFHEKSDGKGPRILLVREDDTEVARELLGYHDLGDDPAVKHFGLRAVTIDNDSVPKGWWALVGDSFALTSQ